MNFLNIQIFLDLLRSLVPQNFSQDPELARWVGTQRGTYAKKLKMEKKVLGLPTDQSMDDFTRRIVLLEEIGFVWNFYDVKWNSNYEELRAYVEQNGFGAMPPQKFNGFLFRWMQRQRKLYRERLQGKTNAITDERISRLDQIGFDWSLK